MSNPLSAGHGMKIVRLEVENVKRLSAVEIEPKGNLVVIGGANGAGKSSVLDSIEYIFSGKGAQPGMPIREGEESARALADLGDITVTRRFWPGGSDVVVEGKDGAVYRRPRELLDGLTGKIAFDPMAFARESPAGQAEIYRQLLGLDFTDLEDKRMGAYTRRTDLNREYKALSVRANSIQVYDKDPGPLVSVSDLTAELSKRKDINAEKQTLVSRAAALVAGQGNWLEARNRMKEQVAAAQEELARAEEGLARATGAAEEAVAKSEKAPRANEVEITEQLGKADSHNQAVRACGERASLLEEALLIKDQADKEAATIDACAAERIKRLEESKPPVPGLSLGASGVTFNGIPFDQASSGEQTRVSVAMGLAMHPKLRVLLVRDGSLLDADNMRLIAEAAAEHDAQVWVERVGEGEECQVIIEDGAVRG